jgi:hypothetical protein
LARACLSCCCLNQVTLPFEHPIPLCDSAVENFGNSAGGLHFIALDNKAGCHGISVCHGDQKKLPFFAPNDSKWCFGTMPFGPRSAVLLRSTLA